MRRRLSLMLFAVVLGVGTVVSIHYHVRATQRSRLAIARTHADTLAIRDSTSHAAGESASDTTCVASRIGIPCDPR